MRSPASGSRVAVGMIGFPAAIFCLFGLVLVITDLRQRGEFLDGLGADIGAVIIGCSLLSSAVLIGVAALRHHIHDR